MLAVLAILPIYPVFIFYFPISTIHSLIKKTWRHTRDLQSSFLGAWITIAPQQSTFNQPYCFCLFHFRRFSGSEHLLRHEVYERWKTHCAKEKEILEEWYSKISHRSRKANRITRTNLHEIRKQTWFKRSVMKTLRRVCGQVRSSLKV